MGGVRVDYVLIVSLLRTLLLGIFESFRTYNRINPLFPITCRMDCVFAQYDENYIDYGEFVLL